MPLQTNITAYAIGIRPKNGAPVPTNQIFSQASEVAAHPSRGVKVGDGFTMTGGGAIVHFSGYGNMLTASYPTDVQNWHAASKDHSKSNPSALTVYAIGLH